MERGWGRGRGGGQNSWLGSRLGERRGEESTSGCTKRILLVVLLVCTIMGLIESFHSTFPNLKLELEGKVRSPNGESMKKTKINEDFWMNTISNDLTHSESTRCPCSIN